MNTLFEEDDEGAIFGTLHARSPSTFDESVIEEQRNRFLEILEEECKEQVYQEFIEQNTRFVPREFVQNHGIGLGLVLRKLPLGIDYKSDFFYFSKSSDDWNAVFIEIEKPQSRFFRGNSNDFHPDFLNAQQQVNNWRGWLSVDQNKATFLSTVRSIHVPAHMAVNPTHFKYVLVFGRRGEYENNQIRRNMVQSWERDDFKILTFDSLAEGLSGKPELTVGIRKNEYIDILGDRVTDSHLYALVAPTQLRVTKALQKRLERGPASNIFIMVNGKRVEALSHAAKSIRTRADQSEL